jgi:hypothetical protein
VVRAVRVVREAGPKRGPKSQQNAQRQGFDLLYTRAILVKE